MSVKALATALTFMAGMATAQGFAVLGGTADGFALPAPGTAFSFPRDHAAHPDFRIEWWYVTGNLTDAQGRAYGIQWTLFRSALAPHETGGWDSPQIWMAHAALTSDRDHRFAERFSRGGVGSAGTTDRPFSAWIDDWQMTSTGGADALDTLRLTARGAAFAYDLQLRADGPLVLHGQDGFSVKSPDGRASHYYSQPFYAVTGTIQTPEGATDVTGTAWLDREWSSQPLAEDQTGWDWVALNLDTGDKLMAAQLRDAGPGYRIGTWIAPDGTATPLTDQDLTLTPGPRVAAGPARVPGSWRITLPARDLDITIDPLNTQAWVGASTAYWEGPVTISGSHGGVGYLEMTGYDQPAEN